jgi:ribosome-associated toxin RatA of RatAB toxin-antitoxin module
MTDRASSTIVVAAPAADVLAVIADFEAYPEWIDSFREAEVLERDDQGRAVRARFVLEAGSVLRDEYTLAYTWREDGVSWQLEQATLMKDQHGSYDVRPVEEGTEVTYELAVDLGVPMLGVLRRKIERRVIETALRDLKKRVEG